MKNLYTLFTALCFAWTAQAQLTCDDALSIDPGAFEVPGIDGDEVPMPICAQNGAGANGGMWYAYTPLDTVLAKISTSFGPNEGLDTRVHIYTGSCGDLECVAGDDDSGAGFLSIVEWVAHANTTYLIAFDDRWNDSGFVFELTESEWDNTPIPIEFESEPLPFLSRSLGTVDMNGDYLDDILDVSSTTVSTAAQIEDLGFVLNVVPTEEATYPYVWSIAAGDLTGNGHNDLLYGGGSGVSFMLRNDNGVGYEEWHDTQYVFSQRSNFIDLNSDGHLDAFVCHDVQPNVYYINDGEGGLTFFQGGISDVPDGGNYGSIWVDYDNDGFPDLFIAKCRGGASLANYNQLFRNNGDGTFTEVSEEAGVYDPVQTWSSAWGDFDNDGFMDVLVGASSFAQGGHKLMRNEGDGTFSEVTDPSGFENLSATGIEWVAYDFDNDGYVDVFGGNGTLMMNNGDMTFTEVELPGIGTGPVGDLNNDGFLDIANNNAIHLNAGNDNNWIKINTKGVVSNNNGIGSRIELYTPAGKQIRDVQSGVGFRFMHTLNVHFGIGSETTVDSLVVNWPSGVVDTYYDIDINTFHLLEEGETEEDNTVSTVDTDKDDFGLFPNPATDELFIKTAQVPVNGRITIYDLQGRPVMQTNYATRLDVSALSPGVYLLEVVGDQRRGLVKFAKTP